MVKQRGSSSTLGNCNAQYSQTVCPMARTAARAAAAAAPASTHKRSHKCCCSSPLTHLARERQRIDHVLLALELHVGKALGPPRRLVGDDLDVVQRACCAPGG